MKFPDFLQNLFLGRRGRLLFIKGKAVYEDFFKEKWPRATRKLFISPFMKGKAVIKTFIEGNGRIRLFMKGNAVIKTFIKGTGRAQRGNFLKS